ncbi:hypothetical protein J4Q44_G00388030 [Coregonus suidteri]|uniref:Uncharacterized protein n=1 Tax=Coregonus suidteri TaxID=861788 RepID=A0AAN8K992_9TELE
MSRHLRNAQTRSSDRWTQIVMVNCLWRSLLREQRTTCPSCDCCSVIPAAQGSRRTVFNHPVLFIQVISKHSPSFTQW